MSHEFYQAKILPKHVVKGRQTKLKKFKDEVPQQLDWNVSSNVTHNGKGNGWKKEAILPKKLMLHPEVFFYSGETDEKKRVWTEMIVEMR